MLKYTGNGFVPNVPARDLSDEEVQTFGGASFLVSTGVYARMQSSSVVPTPKYKKEDVKNDIESST